MSGNYERLLELESTPEALEASSQYIAAQLKPFLSILEPVLICFPNDGPASLGAIFQRAVELCGATAVLWGPDFRWKELLRIAVEDYALLGVHGGCAKENIASARAMERGGMTQYGTEENGDPLFRYSYDGKE